MLVVDTGPLLATADRSDAHHRQCRELLETDAGPLVTTALVIAEACYLLDRQLGPPAEAALLASIVDGMLRVHDLGGGDWARVHELVETYADLRLGGTDASSSPSPSTSERPVSPPSTAGTSAWSFPATPTRSSSSPDLFLFRRGAPRVRAVGERHSRPGALDMHPSTAGRSPLVVGDRGSFGVDAACNLTVNRGETRALTSGGDVVGEET